MSNLTNQNSESNEEAITKFQSKNFKKVVDEVIALKETLDESFKQEREFIQEINDSLKEYIDHNSQKLLKEAESELTKVEDAAHASNESIFYLLNRLGHICDNIGYKTEETIKSESFNYPVFGYIYLIQAQSTDRYKIGLTIRTPEERFNELNRSQSPYPLKYLHSIKVRNVTESEKYFHDLFKANHVHGEWFVFGDINYVIQLMNDYQGQMFE
jgi:T5orf172 domain